MKATQIALRGVWLDPVGGCPHYHGAPEGVGRCDANEMRPCNLETGYPCELIKEIIAEWRLELENKEERRIEADVRG